MITDRIGLQSILLPLLISDQLVWDTGKHPQSRQTGTSPRGNCDTKMRQKERQWPKLARKYPAHPSCSHKCTLESIGKTTKPSRGGGGELANEMGGDAHRLA